MPNYINKIKLPAGTIYELQDTSALHYLGKTSTALTDGATTNPVTINSVNVTAVANDYVLANGNSNNNFYFNGTSWVLMDPAASSSGVTSVGVGNTSHLTVDPVAGTGNVTIDIDTGYSIPLTASQTSWNQKSAGIKASNGTSTEVIADSTHYTTLVAGSNVSILGVDSGADQGKITISATDTTYSTFDATHAGLAPAGGTTAGFLKNDGTWATPTNTTYEFAEGSTNGSFSVTPSGGSATPVAIHGLDNAAYKDVDTSITDSSTSTKLPTSQAVASFVEGKGYTDNEGTVTQIGATGGLKTNKTNNADITDNGTLELNLKDTAYSTAVGNKETTTQIYPVVLDSAGYPCVGVPWTDTTYTQAANSAITVNNTDHTIDVAVGAVGTKGVVELSTSIPAVSSAVDTKVATEKAVASAIDALPEPMIFKGSVGDSGIVTWTNLPSAASSNEGYTYKVITKHTTAPICEVGDTIISNGSEWVVIPSGDEPKGDVTGIKLGTSGSTYSPDNSGIVELPAYPTSMAITDITGIATNTSITGVSTVNQSVSNITTSAASGTAPTNGVNQFSYDSSTARLTINYLTFTKGDSITTATTVNNVVTKSS